MIPKPVFAALLPFFMFQAASAQYYYKDILSIRESGRQQQLYSQNNVRTVTIQSFDPDGTENKDFFCKQSVSQNFTRLETLSGSSATGQSALITTFSTDADHRVVSSEDSSRDAVTTTNYSYDASGNIANISSVSRTSDTTGATDSAGYSTSEQHIWHYTAAGKPDHMLRVKVGGDTTFIRFETDSLGDITDEIASRKGSAKEHYYYYYNDHHQLTDIVRFNPKMAAMMPDYIFEYDETTGKLSKMTVVQAINDSYLVWYYEYNPEGLTVKEFCYDKSKQLIGTIGYTYH